MRKKPIIMSVCFVFVLFILPFIIKGMTVKPVKLTDTSHVTTAQTAPDTSTSTQVAPTTPVATPTPNIKTPSISTPNYTSSDTSVGATCQQNQQALDQENQAQAQMKALSAQMDANSRQFGQGYNSSSGISYAQWIANYQSQLQQDQSQMSALQQQFNTAKSQLGC